MMRTIIDAVEPTALLRQKVQQPLVYFLQSCNSNTAFGDPGLVGGENCEITCVPNAPGEFSGPWEQGHVFGAKRTIFFAILIAYYLAESSIAIQKDRAPESGVLK